MGISNRNLPVSWSMFHVVFFTITVFCCFRSSIARNDETDREALLDFKAKIDDPLGVMSSWNDMVHFCNWYGLTCGRRHHRVTALILPSSQLGGSISPYIGNLSFLNDLELYNNSLTGKIPPEIGRLYRLQYLLLHNNSIGGQIPPNISACSKLIQLRVSNNELVGGIPFELGFMASLQYLSLDNNNLSGNIPLTLGNISSLSILSVTGTNLVGSIPDSLGQLKNLRFLTFFNNMLTGTVPSSIFNLSKLIGLDLGFNNFEGKLPWRLGITLPNLQILYAGTNQFSGSIPATISNVSNLEQLQLNDIGLTGQVPSLHNLQKLILLDIGGNLLGTGGGADLSFISSLTNATSLGTLSIGDNKFSGRFPGAICNFSSTLRLLKMGYLNLTGYIPPCIGDLANLQELSVRFNQLLGVIPPEIGKLKNLAALFLNSNQFSGSIPSSLGNLTKLTILDLSENKLQSQIPSSIESCSNLLQLSFYHNDLGGSISLQLPRIPRSIYKLILSANHLNGSLPTEIGSLKNLVQLEISDNMISGQIPSDLGGCTELQILLMEGNLFQGTIPLSLSSLKDLQYLDLSCNNLSGEIPKYLASFVLQKLNLTYNTLEGEVPVGGVFSNASSVSVVGNRGLCGGILDLRLPPCNFKKSSKRKSKHRRRLLIAIISASLGAILLVTFVIALAYVSSSKMRRKEHATRYSDRSPTNLSYQSLLKATNRFSTENLIGTGSFGSVYKGILDQEKNVIAVKVLHLEHPGALKSFTAECEALKNVRHRNLVKVITACSSVDYQGNDFKAIVYEFMVNGSLEDWLHPTPIQTDYSKCNAFRHLNLCQRLNIAVDVAFALEYLHHHCVPPLVHCDLKPSNVLLDAQKVAHISDFGLAKFLSEAILDNNASQSSSIGVRGTIGYTPPEYALGNQVTTYGDIYSFGILLLEMFTGKKPTDKMFTESLNLRDVVKAALPDRVTEVLDPVLVHTIVGGERESLGISLVITSNEGVLEALITVLRIGLYCSADLPRERLNISATAAKLSSIRSKLFGTLSQNTT